MPGVQLRLDAALVYLLTLNQSSPLGLDAGAVGERLAAAGLVLEHGGAEEQAVAALLVDLLQQQPRAGRTRVELGAQQGTGVLELLDRVGSPAWSEVGWRQQTAEVLQGLSGAERADEARVRGSVQLARMQRLGRRMRQDPVSVRPTTWEAHAWYTARLVHELPEGPLRAELAHGGGELWGAAWGRTERR